MCLIIDKPEGEEIPIEWLMNSHMFNCDGWGVMWAEDGTVRVDKGFRLKALVKAVQRRPKESHIAVHMRAATSGKKDIKNCHPYSVSNGTWMMHNGIIRIPTLHERWSDTKHFADLCVGPMLDRFPSLYGTSFLKETLGYFIGAGNKLLFMNGKGEVMIVNEDAGIKKGDCWLSNDYSISSSYGMYGCYGDYEDYEWNRASTEADTPAINPEYEWHECAACRLSMECERTDWEFLAGMGWLCPMCSATIQEDLRKSVDITLDDVMSMGYEEIKEFCENSPETMALVLMSDLGKWEER